MADSEPRALRQNSIVIRERGPGVATGPRSVVTSTSFAMSVVHYRTVLRRRFERQRRVALLLLGAAACTIAAPACVPTAWSHTSGRWVGTSVSDARFARLRSGVNLSRWFTRLPGDSAHPDAVTGYNTADDFRQIRALGFQHVRLPVDPDRIFHQRDPSRVDGPYLDALDRAVDSILGADLAVIVDIHARDGAPFKRKLEDDDRHVQRVAAFWEALARHFSTRDPDRVFLEVLNESEVHDRDRWDQVQATLLAAMRRGAPRHTLIVTGARWGSAKDLARLEPVADRNVVYDFHFYEPYVFTHQGANWAVQAWKYLHGLPYPSSVEGVAPALDHIRSARARVVALRYGTEEWNADRIGDRIGEVSAWASAHGVRVMCGEFGVYRSAPRASRLAWLHDVRTELERVGFGWSVWDYSSQTFGILESSARTARVADAEVVRALGVGG